MPPRGRQDMSCVNCGAKGHSGAECKKARVDRKDQPCFVCGKTGHQARLCPNKPKPGGVAPVHALTDSGVPRKVQVMMMSTVEPKVGDYIKTQKGRGQVNHNRYQELTLENEEFWRDVKESVSHSQPLAAATSLGRAPTTPLMSRAKLVDGTDSDAVSDPTNESFPLLPGGDSSDVRVRAAEKVAAEKLCSSFSALSSCSTTTPSSAIFGAEFIFFEYGWSERPL